MHCCKLTLYAISSKTNEPNLTNWQKTYFRAQFWPLRPKFKPQIFFRGFHPYQMLDNVAYKLSLNAISKKNNKPNKENGKKTSLGSNFGAFGPNSGRQFFFFFFFFFKNLAPSITRYHGQLSWFTISEKTNDPILRKLSDGRTDRWARVIS